MNLVARLVVWSHEHDVPAFLVLQAASLLIAGGVFLRRLPRSARFKLGFVVAMIIGAPAGAILLGIVLRLPRYVASRGADHLLSDGWLAAYGALAGTVLAVEVAARITRVRATPSGRPLDPQEALAPALGLLVAVGRVGCLLAGCDFGAPSRLPWAIRYPPDTPAFEAHLKAGLIATDASRSLSVHPTQLYEALVGVAAFLAAELALRGRGLAGAGALQSAAVVYAVGRFGVEMLRGDVRPTASGLSVAQWLSIVVVALTIAVVARPRARGLSSAQRTL